MQNKLQVNESFDTCSAVAELKRTGRFVIFAILLTIYRCVLSAAEQNAVVSSRHEIFPAFPFTLSKVVATRRIVSGRCGTLVCERPCAYLCGGLSIATAFRETCCWDEHDWSSVRLLRGLGLSQPVSFVLFTLIWNLF